MTINQQIAKHFREVHFGGNWTWVNLKDTLSDVTWEQANAQAGTFNTIVKLVYHIHYFVQAVIPVLDGGVLDASDKLSFNHPPVNSQQDWEQFLDKVWADAERFASLLEQLPDDILHDTFTDEKYGNYFRNMHGIIEHTHYHLGQIVIIKKLVQSGA